MFISTVELFMYIKNCFSCNCYFCRMLDQYKCESNAWLTRLYSIRHMWCPVYSKNVFSGGILSSQRSESTNEAITRKIRATSSLCDFYSNFNQVVFEWRSKEVRFDFQSWEGPHEMFLENVPILSNARQIYTAEVYKKVEEQFKKAAACVHSQGVNLDGVIHYEVWRLELDRFHHIVKFNRTSHDITCTCKLWDEVGILCSHCLHVFGIYSVVNIPCKYILKRWTKDLTSIRRIGLGFSPAQVAGCSSSAWRIQIIRKFLETAALSDHNKKAMDICDKRLKELDDEVRQELGIVAFPGDIETNEQPMVIRDSEIQNPISKRTKGKRNKRLKSTRELKGNQAKARNKCPFSARARSKEVVQASVPGSYIHSVI